jgi:hypothetical protein
MENTQRENSLLRSNHKIESILNKNGKFSVQVIKFIRSNKGEPSLIEYSSSGLGETYNEALSEAIKNL